MARPLPFLWPGYTHLGAHSMRDPAWRGLAAVIRRFGGQGFSQGPMLWKCDCIPHARRGDALRCAQAALRTLETAGAGTFVGHLFEIDARLA